MPDSEFKQDLVSKCCGVETEQSTLSYCCGAQISESGICYECKDHSEPDDDMVCSKCLDHCDEIDRWEYESEAKHNAECDKEDR